MQMGNFEDSEMLSAKRTMISGVLQLSDNPSAIEAFKFRRFLANVCEDADEAIEKINAVTREEIISVAQKVRFDSVYFLCGAGEEEEEYDE